VEEGEKGGGGRKRGGEKERQKENRSHNFEDENAVLYLITLLTLIKADENKYSSTAEGFQMKSTNSSQCTTSHRLGRTTFD
jgi:hypothetical protein